MDKDLNKFIFVTDDGVEIEYEKLMSFNIDGTLYVIFTDNTKDEENKLNTYAYYFDETDKQLKPVEDDSELEKVNEVFDKTWKEC